MSEKHNGKMGSILRANITTILSEIRKPVLSLLEFGKADVFCELNSLLGY
jgi:hypothetical protein